MLLVLALVVSSGVFWQLRLTGLSQTGDAYCGHMEHQHSESCMERTLICSSENGEDLLSAAAPQEERELLCTLPEHAHGEDCYEYRQELVCVEEHEHTEACMEEQACLVCSLQEHQHGDDCYGAVAPQEQEAEEISEHIHTEECYETTYTCGFDPEYDHIHTLQCYSDPEADLETPEMWQSSVSLAALTGDPAEDLAAVAETQLGYRESRSNYTVDDDGVSYRGYTRYGDWYGDPYGRWDALFVSFCLHYAGVPQEAICQFADTAAWPGALALRGVYESSADYTGAVGDIVFFDTDGDAAADAVGIISHVSETGLTFISGGERAVVAETCSFGDEAIMGYAVVSRTPASDPLAGETMQLFAANGSEVELGGYVSGYSGSINIQLLDKNGNLMQESTAYENEAYQLAFDVDLRGKDGQAGHGFLPGVYYYQLPANVSFLENAFGEYDEGDIKNDSSEVFGRWHVDPDSSRLIFEFYLSSDENQDVHINLKFGVVFTLQEDPIDFDGIIRITILPEEGYTPPTASLSKTGAARDKNGVPVIEWTVTIQGAEDYPLAGLYLTDTLLGDGCSPGDQLWLEFHPPGGGYYSYGVYRDAFTDNGWTYTIPESFTCEGCNDEHYYDGASHTSHTVYVGNDWKCFIYYSTPINSDASASNYQNQISGGDKTDIATVLPGTGAGVVKSGRMEDGAFKWTIALNIPEGSYFQWYLWDATKVKGPNELEAQQTCSFENAVMQAFYNGSWINVPSVEQATASDPFAWKSEPYEDGACGLYLLNRCTCSAENHCTDWSSSNEKCRNRVQGADGTYFCYCWSQPQSVAFEITYDTPAGTDIISQYGGDGSYLQNYVSLGAKAAKGSEERINGGESTARITIPGVFTKKLLAKAESSNSYTARFSISVNEEMRDLSQESQGAVTIVDRMSDSLFYEQGSMVITGRDAMGNTVPLTPGDDYTIDVSEDFHTLTINILAPGRYLYRLEYNAAVNVSDSYGGVVLYDNSATVTLLGQNYNASIDQQTLSDFTSTAANFSVTITKTDESDPSKRLAGAEFGLYNKNGGLITSGETDNNGTLIFRTNITHGIVFRTDEPYYLQEIEAPPGYAAGDTCYWFYFADQTNSRLEADYPGILRFPAANRIYAGELTVKNVPYAPILPATGGPGTLPFAIGGMLLMAAPLLRGCIFRRKYRERRPSKNLRSG